MSDDGFPLDVTECNKQIKQLQDRIDWADVSILPLIPSKIVQDKTTITKVYKLNGQYTKQVLDWMGEEPQPNLTVGGAFNRVKYVDINLASTKQVNEWLLSNGWEPKKYNYKKDKAGKEIKDFYGNKIKTSPKLVEEDYEDLKSLGPAACLIVYRRQISHKRNQIQGFLRNQRPDGTVPSVVNTLGAATRRMTHSVIANVPAPKEGALWKDMRKVFYAPEGYKIVGCDADQCQVRGLAHYMNDLAFMDRVNDPTIDLHASNAKVAGVTRPEAKNIYYGYIFGAGIPKTASQIGCTQAEAQTARDKYEKALPMIQPLMKAINKYYNKHGYIMGIDGVKVYATSPHMLLCYLLQNFEEVLVKIALVLACEKIEEKGIDARLATIQHDEFQFIVEEERTDDVSLILEESFETAGTIIGSRCIIKGKAAVGQTWYDTH